MVLKSFIMKNVNLEFTELEDRLEMVQAAAETVKRCNIGDCSDCVAQTD